MSPGAIRVLLAEMLSGAVGGSIADWLQRIGEISVLPITLNPRGNWRVAPTGSADEIDAIERAVEIVAAEHPYTS